MSSMRIQTEEATRPSPDRDSERPGAQETDSTVSGVPQNTGADSSSEESETSLETSTASLAVSADKVDITPTQMMRYFVHRRQPYAVQTDRGYRVVDQSLTTAVIRKHLLGELTVGVYSTAPENTVRWICFDLDTQDYGPMYRIIASIRGPFLCENSGHKGRHIWQFFKRPVEASLARAYGNGILNRAGVECEFFPKQDSIGDGLGNLVKLPFGIHRVSGSWSTKESGELRTFDFDESLIPGEVYVPTTPQSSKPRPPKEETATFISEVFSGASAGNRNNTMNKFIYWLWEREFPREAVEMLAEYANKSFQPPISEEELSSLLRERY